MKNRSASSLFLVELLLSILFFSLAAAVCVQLFVQSHLISRKSADQNAAVTCMQSTAAILEAESGSLSALSEIYTEGSLQDGSFTVYYDQDWQECAADCASSCIQVERRETAEGLLSFILTAKSSTDEEPPIYTLEFSLHLPYTLEDTTP